MEKIVSGIRMSWSRILHSGLVHALALVSAACVIFEGVRGNFLNEQLPPLPILYNLALEQDPPDDYVFRLPRDNPVV